MKGKRLLFNVSFSTCIILLVLILPASGQAVITFERAYGGPDDEHGFSVQQTLDGGYVVVGITDSTISSADVYLIKTDVSGDTLWTKTYGGSRWDMGLSVRQTADGGYIVAGYTFSFGAGFTDVYLIKTDSLGNKLWERTYGDTLSNCGRSVQQTQDGGYIVAGDTRYFDGAGYDLDVYLLKTDSLGDTTWTRTYGGASDERSYSVQQTLDRGYVIVGKTKSFGAGWDDVYLIKTDCLGNMLWERTYGGSHTDAGVSVQQTLDRGYVIVGQTESFGALFTDVYLIKTDSLGNMLWERTYGDTGWDSGRSVQQTWDGGYIITGRRQPLGPERSHASLIKTDSAGNIVWERTYGGNDDDAGLSVQQTLDGGYVIAGYTESIGAGGADVYLIKTDRNGLVGVYNPASLKQNVIAELDTLNPQSKGLAKKIKKAKKHIEKSLESKRWLDEIHLHHKHGNKVFYEEKKAVKDIKKLCKKGEFPSGFCERLIRMLVEADSILARVAIDDAKTANGKEKEIEKAEKEMAKAEKDKQKGKYDKAIDHYKHAWQHAMKAVKKHKQRNQMIGETKGDRRTMLLQNHPNPCRGFTIINYQLPEPAPTILRIYDTSGRLARILVDGSREAGHHRAHRDGRDGSGNLVPSGVYFYQIKAGDYTAAKKLLLVR